MRCDAIKSFLKLLCYSKQHKEDRAGWPKPAQIAKNGVNGCLNRGLALRLLQLDERAAEVLRMQEQHGLAMRANLRLATAQHARALGHEPVAGGQNVVNLVADVVDAAIRVALQELRDGRVRARAVPEARSWCSAG